MRAERWESRRGARAGVATRLGYPSALAQDGAHVGTKRDLTGGRVSAVAGFL
jgi:hypothetical protein